MINLQTEKDSGEGAKREYTDKLESLSAREPFFSTVKALINSVRDNINGISFQLRWRDSRAGRIAGMVVLGGTQISEAICGLFGFGQASAHPPKNTLGWNRTAPPICI